jgi:hypothetical protein
MPDQKYPGSEDEDLDALHKVVSGGHARKITVVSGLGGHARKITITSELGTGVQKKRRPGPYDRNPIRRAKLAQKRAEAEAARENADKTEENK